MEHNLRLVVYIARRFEGASTNIEDLISIGTIGLIKAVGTYRMDKNIKLATYASRCIENEILMHMRKISNQKAEVSLDEPINMDGEGNELLLSDILGTEEDVIQRPLEEAVDMVVLRKAVSELPDREREIILMRYGMQGRKELTQKEVAQYMGISQSYILPPLCRCLGADGCAAGLRGIYGVLRPAAWQPGGYVLWCYDRLPVRLCGSGAGNLGLCPQRKTGFSGVELGIRNGKCIK